LQGYPKKIPIEPKADPFWKKIKLLLYDLEKSRALIPVSS